MELRGISSKVNNFTTRNRWKEEDRVESVANECTLQFHGKRSRERPAYDRSPSLPFDRLFQRDDDIGFLFLFLSSPFLSRLPSVLHRT